MAYFTILSRTDRPEVGALMLAKSWRPPVFITGEISSCWHSVWEKSRRTSWHNQAIALLWKDHCQDYPQWFHWKQHRTVPISWCLQPLLMLTLAGVRSASFQCQLHQMYSLVVFWSSNFHLVELLGSPSSFQLYHLGSHENLKLPFLVRLYKEAHSSDI